MNYYILTYLVIWAIGMTAILIDLFNDPIEGSMFMFFGSAIAFLLLWMGGAFVGVFG